MTNDGQDTLVYDGENRLTSSSGSLGSGTYTYDGRGLRVKKVAGSTTTVYIFSGSKVIAEYDNGAAVGSPSREYIYAGGALLAKIDAGGTRYYQRDHLSNRLITDSSGNILAQLGHSPFGESWYNATNERWLFTTYERDAESGNDYAMARSYASRLGRFLSPDPAAGGISDPQSLNRYSYAHNDPINFVDPSGMFVAPQIYALMRFYNVPMFGSLWNEFDLLEFAFTPSGEVPVVRNGDPGFMDVYGNLGALDFLTGGGGGAPKKYAVDLKVLNDCLSKMGIKTTISSLTPSTPGGYGSASGKGEDWFSGHGNVVPITVNNDAHTYNAVQVGGLCDLPEAFGCTLRASPYTNYTNNNNNAIGTVTTQVWELGNSLWSIQAGSIFVPIPQGKDEPGNILEKCVKAGHGIQAQ